MRTVKINTGTECLKYLSLLVFIFILPSLSAGQVAINADGSQPDPSAMLEIKSTNKGFLVPRLTTQEREAIQSPANGLMVYDIDLNSLALFESITAQWKLYKPGTAPVSRISDSDLDTWVETQTGDANGDSIVFHLGALSGPGSNKMVLVKNSSGQARLEFPDPAYNTYIGDNAGEHANSLIGIENVGVGYNALHTNYNGIANVAVGAFSLSKNYWGNGNTAIGLGAMQNNESGIENVAVGRLSLGKNLNGDNNIAIGPEALANNGYGDYNIAIGRAAIGKVGNSEGVIAIGDSALFRNEGDINVAVGYHSLVNNTQGGGNSALGAYTIYKNTTGYSNSAFGVFALQDNQYGKYNTALGSYALWKNKGGNNNVAVGNGALYHWDGDKTVAIGDSALFSLQLNAPGNSALGSRAGFYNESGRDNTAIGFEALFHNKAGFNTASGVGSLYRNTTGTSNTADGYYTLYNNESGIQNTALGTSALRFNKTGSNNTAVGYNAGATIIPNILAGGDYSTYLGASTGTALGADFDYSTAVGAEAIIFENNQVVIGRPTINKIGGYKGWTTYPSDSRFKTAVKEDVKGLDFILRLRPVTYEVDHAKIASFFNRDLKTEGQNEMKNGANERQIGFIAQEVENAARLAGFEFSGIDKPESKYGLYGLRYAEFTVPLVKAVQEQQAQIEQLKAENAQLRAQLNQLQTLEARIQALENQQR